MLQAIPLFCLAIVTLGVNGSGSCQVLGNGLLTSCGGSEPLYLLWFALNILLAVPQVFLYLGLEGPRTLSEARRIIAHRETAPSGEMGPPTWILWTSWLLSLGFICYALPLALFLSILFLTPCAYTSYLLKRHRLLEVAKRMGQWQTHEAVCAWLCIKMEEELKTA